MRRDNINSTTTNLYLKMIDVIHDMTQKMFTITFDSKVMFFVIIYINILRRLYSIPTLTKSIVLQSIRENALRLELNVGCLIILLRKFYTQFLVPEILTVKRRLN